jgi:hypothetical protein
MNVLETTAIQSAHEVRDGKSDIQQIFAAMDSSPSSEGKGEHMLGGQPRREHQLLSRTRVYVDRVEATD